MLKTKITDLDQDIEDIDQEVLALNDQYYKFRMEKNYYVKQKRMKELAKEIEEMKEMINEKVKDPAIIRRNSIQAFSDLAII